MIIKDLGQSLGTSKVLDARRRGVPTEAYKQYAASPSTSLRIVSLSNERSDRPSSAVVCYGGWKGNAALRLTQGHEPVEWQMTP